MLRDCAGLNGKLLCSVGNWALKHTASATAQLLSAISRFLTGTCGVLCPSLSQGDPTDCVHASMHACAYVYVHECDGKRRRARKNKEDML